MSTSLQPRGASVGVVIDGGGEDFHTVEPELVRTLLPTHGSLLLRGYRVTVEALHAFTDALFDRRLVYGGARAPVTEDDGIQTVELGFHRLGLHCEMAYTPLRPDLAVFHCVTPANDGGETLLGDGCAIFEALSPSTQALLRSSRSKYHNAITRPAWERMFGTTDPSVVAAVLDPIPELTWRFEGDGTLRATHVAPSTIADRRGGRVAWADSVHRFPGTEPEDFMFGLKKTWTELEDGPLPDEVREELHTVCDRLETPIGWQPGDVVILDNWTVLHGRAAFTDPNRRILAAFGYAGWAAR